MNLARRQKFMNSGKTIVKTNRKIDINFDLVTLDLMASYVLSNNRNIRQSQLINMRNVFELLDMSLYSNDIEKMKRLEFIKKALEARTVMHLQEPKLILKYTVGGILDDSNLTELYGFATLSNEELEWINGTISDALKYTFIYNNVDRGIDLLPVLKQLILKLELI